MEKKKGYNKLLVVLGVLLVVGVGVSFSYYLAKVLFSGEGSSVGVATENINGSEVNVLGTLDFNDTGVLPGHKNISSVKVTATGEGEFLVYNLIWTGTNTLNTPLKYKIYRTNTNITTSASCEQKRKLVNGSIQYSEECTIASLEELGYALSSGTINKGETKVTLATAETITSSTSGTETYYYIELEYPNLETSQNSDIGGSMNGKIKVEETLIDCLVVSKIGDESTNDVLGKSIARSSFESITTLASKNVPANAIESWDASQKHNGSIMAWYTDSNNNGLYELYIGQDGGVIANPNSSWLFGRYSNLTNIDLSHFDTTNVTTMWGMFHSNTSLTSLDLSNFDTSKVTNMESVFNDMPSLEDLNVSSFDTSNVTNMLWMFANMPSLIELNVSSFDTSEVTRMDSMFFCTRSLVNLNLSNFNTSNVTTMSYMFSGMQSLTNLNVNSFNTSKVTNMAYMFQNMTSLTDLNISSFDTSNVTNMEGMFARNTALINLDLSNFNTTEVTTMKWMFSEVFSLTDLDLSNFNTSNVTDMSNMFAGMSSLINLNVSSFNTSKVTTMTSMFGNMHAIINLNLSNFDTSNVTDMAFMFYNDASLQTLNLNKATFDNVTNAGSMFINSGVSTINVKDINAQNFINIYLSEAGKTATVTIV